MTGYLVFAHGSSVESANEAVRVVTRRVASANGYSLMETAFLEGGKPSLSDGVGLLMRQGADRIVVIPYFLTLGLHLKRDLPRLIDEARQEYPGLGAIEVTEPLDGHPALDQIVRDRAEAAR